ncbi:MAG: FixH family protein [Nitrospirota bacterium]|jgi:hypothetical protein
MNFEKIMRASRLGAIMVLGVFLLAFGEGRIGTEQGNYFLKVKFATEPVRVGRTSMNLKIYDETTGQPSKGGLDVTVFPWMPFHEHGSREVPIVTSLGDGEYLVENLTFTMAGEWEVFVIIKDEDIEDEAVFVVKVQK